MSEAFPTAPPNDPFPNTFPTPRPKAIDSMSNAELDRLAESKDRQRPLRFKFRLLRDLRPEPPAKDWIVKGVVAAGETSAWIGPPGSLKSALLGELAFSIAAKQDWHGHRAKRSGLVCYFALERSDLVDRRLLAYQARHDGEPEGVGPIAVIPGMVDLMRQETVAHVVAVIRAIEEDTGEQCVLTIWDTFAKLIAAGGGDENLAKDQGQVFANVQRIKDAIGCHVALIGHTGKNEERGARGSNALLGDVDLMVTLSGETVKAATVTKANDAPEGPLFSFISEVHEFGQDEDGDPITVNVVSPEEQSVQPAPKGSEPKLSANQQTFYRLLFDAGPQGLTLEAWNNQAKALGIGTNRKATLHDLRKALEDRKMVREYGGRWKVNHG